MLRTLLQGSIIGSVYNLSKCVDANIWLILLHPLLQLALSVDCFLG